MSALDDIKARTSGHTPGPWVYHASIGRVEDVPEFDLHRFDIMAIGIAKVEESDADGELIAAAPKLLAALEALEALVNGMDCASKDNTHGAWDLGYNTALRSAAGLVRDAINEALEGAA